jgi:hypothetical protein
MKSVLNGFAAGVLVAFGLHEALHVQEGTSFIVGFFVMLIAIGVSENYYKAKAGRDRVRAIEADELLRAKVRAELSGEALPMQRDENAEPEPWARRFVIPAAAVVVIIALVEIWQHV